MKHNKKTGGELYAKIDGKFIPLAGVAIGPGVTPIKKTSISDAIHKYIDLCTSQKCTKNQSVEVSFFLRFQVFLEIRKYESIDEVTSFDMLEFQNELGRKLKPSSVNRRFCTIKNFFNMCERWKLIHTNPCKEIKKKKFEPNPFNNWEQCEFDQFLSRTKGMWTFIFTFLWLTGCRPMELKNLSWNDLDFKNQTMKFRCGKNANFVREFPMTQKTEDLLRKIERVNEFVFTREGRQIKNDSLSIYARKHLNRCGFKHLSAYGLRHTFAKRLAEAGVNPFYIQKLMGHADIKTTMGYVHDEKNSLKNALDQLK